MHKMKNIALIAIIVALGAGCKKENGTNMEEEKVFTYNFTENTEGWLGGFADWHPPYESNDWGFVFERTPLPAPLNTSKYALQLGGMNRSDDLFMFLKKEISGLGANTTYNVVFELEIASNAPTDGMGVGGAPHLLTIKAGAVLLEPDTIFSTDENLFIMKNIEKGYQSQGGKDVKILGDIGVAPGQTDYALITRNNKNNPHSIKTGANGKVWVLIGTDSAFEGRSDIYYSQIKITFKRVG